MRIEFQTRENGPKNLLAEAEIVFESSDGILCGAKLVGFAVWATESGPVATVPSRTWGQPGERKFFDLLRNVGDPAAMKGVKAAIVDAYQHHVAEEALPRCVRAMKCYCAGHARGNPATDPCDTSEKPLEKPAKKRGHARPSRDVAREPGDPWGELPTLRGKLAGRRLAAMYGIPNSAPTDAEYDEVGPVAAFTTRRSVFVDDFNDGEPRALWAPDREEWL